MRINLDQIQEVLNEKDIEGLLTAGAPTDEYYTEARMIQDAITRAQPFELTEDHLTSVVRAIWNEMFGPFSDDQLRRRESAFRNVARRVMD